MTLRSITSVKHLKGKRVLLRIDANVPIVNGKAVDGKQGRIARAAEGIRWLIEHGAEVIVMMHLGRPSGKEKISVQPIADRLRRLLGAKMFAHVTLLDNLRHDPREEKNDLGFAKELAALGDIYVNDAFGVCHRAHASVSAIQKLLPSYAGPLLVNEVKRLSAVRDNPKRPFVLLLGGAKLETKVGLLKKLGPKADVICLGGALANTFLAAAGKDVGSSLFEKEELKTTKTILKQFGKKIVLPIDSRRDHGAIDDVGPESIKRIIKDLDSAKTIVWNGPLGRCEVKKFCQSTRLAAKKIASCKGAVTIVGGGDTVPIVEEMHLGDRFTLLSTGGGAMLAFLSGEKLPGLEPLIVK